MEEMFDVYDENGRLIGKVAPNGVVYDANNRPIGEINEQGEFVDLNGNVISPKILGESMGLSSFWVIFAILAGQGILGFWGMIIGIPVFAVIYSAVKTFISSRLTAQWPPVPCPTMAR